MLSISISIVYPIISYNVIEVKISSPLMTQGGQPCKQQNCAQGGPPCAWFKLCRAVRPPNSKMVRRVDRPVHHMSYAGRSTLLANWCAGKSALCIIQTTQGGPPYPYALPSSDLPCLFTIPCDLFVVCRAYLPSVPNFASILLPWVNTFSV